MGVRQEVEPVKLYRYGFNGMEKDDEVSGSGNSYTTFYRLNDPRIGRWRSVDPKADLMPWASTYVSMGNNPILATDPKGDVCIPCITAAAGAVIGGGVNAYSQYKDGTLDLSSGESWARIGTASLAGGIAGSGLGGLAVGTVAIAGGEAADQMIVSGGEVTDVSKVVTAGALAVAGGVVLKGAGTVLEKTGATKVIQNTIAASSKTKMNISTSGKVTMSDNSRELLKKSDATVGAIKEGVTGIGSYVASKSFDEMTEDVMDKTEELYDDASEAISNAADEVSDFFSDIFD